MQTNKNIYSCPQCCNTEFSMHSSLWECRSCNTKYVCISGIPNLCIEHKIAAHDVGLRNTFYEGIFGIWYSFMMPFIVLPVRPLLESFKHWLLVIFIYLLLVSSLVDLVMYFENYSNSRLIAPIISSASLIWLYIKQRYIIYLLILAIPVKISLSLKKYKPINSFKDVHARIINEIELHYGGKEKINILDVSTGSCNSLFKHGWMNLNATYTGLDLSQTMIKQGQKKMADNRIPINLIIGDGMNLPFIDECFDVVLNYGAINGMAYPEKALSEMSRVCKPGGFILFLDEQLYSEKNAIERLFFLKVLSNHNTIHHCPVEMMPLTLNFIRVDQIYEFYYICTARKI